MRWSILPDKHGKLCKEINTAFMLLSYTTSQYSLGLCTEVRMLNSHSLRAMAHDACNKPTWAEERSLLDKTAHAPFARSLLPGDDRTPMPLCCALQASVMFLFKLWHAARRGLLSVYACCV